MCCIGIDIDCKCRGASAESTRSDSQSVDLFKHFFFQICHPWNFRLLIEISGKCLLCHQCRFFKGSANTDTYDHRRAGIRTCILYRGENGIFYTLDPICKDPAHIFTAKTLWRKCDLYLISGHDRIMDDSRCIILGIDALDRITYDRLAQIAINITLAHTLIDGIRKTSTFKVYLLTNFYEHDRHTGILTDWDHILSCNL